MSHATDPRGAVDQECRSEEDAHVLNSLSRLKLMRLPDRLDRLAEEAAAKGWTCVEFLDHLLEAEAETVIIRIREAGDGKQQEQEQRKA